MHLHPIRYSLIVIGAIGALAAAPSMATFDRRQLLEQGEDYVVALHDSYEKAAKEMKDGRHPEIPTYFKDRAVAIENGEECFPAHPSEFPISDEKTSARLEWAYEETFDIVTSEAGDVAPHLTANVQIAYETWLITMHLDPSDPDGEKLAANFDKSLDNLTASPKVSALTPASPVMKASFGGTTLGSALPRHAVHRI